MAETSRDQNQSRQPGASPAEAPPPPSLEQPRALRDAGVGGTVASRKPQYLIGTRPLPGLAPVPSELILQRLGEIGDVEIVRQLRLQRPEALAREAMPSLAAASIVVRMDDRRAEELRRTAAPNLVIEPDGLLHLADAMPAGAGPFRTAGRAKLIPCPGKTVAFRIVGENDRPLAGARIFVFASGFPAEAVTDASGQATLTFYDEHNDPGGTGAVPRAVYVRPAADHWDRLIAEPALADGANVIRLLPLSQNFASFPSQRLVGWGQRMMKLDQLADGLDGSGVKIGLIDTGCDHTHPLLRQVTQGVEIVDPARPSGWTIDPIGQGTHCAGIIAAGERSRAEGILGFAPGAELHILKVLPGGRCSDLINALDECIARRLDVVAIGVGTDQPSELVALKLAEARQNGVACIVAADGSGGLALTPGVLAVSAVGKLGEFPPDTSHELTARGASAGGEGLFLPAFAGSYPQPQQVYAPGVAIVSTVPGGGYAAWDGNAIAAAHVTGFAAVLLAHYPLFQGVYRSRGEQRVAALMETIRASSELSRLGTGVPGWALLAPSAGAALPQTMSRLSGLAGAVPQTGPLSAPAYFANPLLLQLRALGMI
jgi:subtilisin